MKHFKKLTIALLALLSVSATAWAQEETQLTTIRALSNYTFTSGSKTFDDKATVTFSGNVSYTATPDFSWYHSGSDDRTITVTAADGYTITRVKFTSYNGTSESSAFDEAAPFEAALNSNKLFVNGTSIGFGVYRIEVYGYQNIGPDVTINDAKSEASFTMPQYDVTATYSLKRDMAVSMAVTVQDAQQNSRFRVQKQGNDFVPVGLTNAEVMALFNVHDKIENADLTAATDYTVQIFAADEQGQPTGTAMTFQNFTYAPGQYIVKAVATEGSNYAGETALSNVFTLFQGYEIEVAAGEYATYYKDEALYVEDEDAKLYTITAVSGDKATATELTVAAANTPILVKNNGSETKTILLIPTTTSDKVDVYPGFLGTLTATTIAASDATADRYALNGLQFVWVKNAIPVAANKAWLEIPAASASNAPRLTIVFDSEATGISTTNYTNFTNDEFYDLNGRKLNGKPTKKGVYIRNGKKVVVK